MERFWTVLTVAFLALFAVGETWALATHRRTYSSWWRRVLGIRPPRWWRRLAAAGVGAFLVWFLPHLGGLW